MKFLLYELKEWVEFALRHIPGRCGLYFRAFYYRVRMGRVGVNFRAEPGFRVEFPASIFVGERCYFGPGLKLYATPSSKIVIGDNFSANSNVMINIRGRGSIVIGNNVLIGPNVVIRANNHKFELVHIPIADQEMTEGDIVIGDDVWIGSNAVILPNVHIGTGAVVAAGAIVTKNIDNFSIVAGVPARKIGDRK